MTPMLIGVPVGAGAVDWPVPETVELPLVLPPPQAANRVTAVAANTAVFTTGSDLRPLVIKVILLQPSVVSGRRRRAAEGTVGASSVM